jgi:ketosteroid isomerase-like protein
MSDQNKKTVEGIFKAMAAGDWDELLASFHDDVVVEWPQTRERMTGKNACLTVFQNYPGGPPQLEVKRLSSDGDLVVAEGEVKYPDGSLWTIASVFTFEGDKVKREVDYFGQVMDAPGWRAEWVTRIAD